MKRSQTTGETDKTGGKREVEDESLDEKTVIIREGDKKLLLFYEQKAESTWCSCRSKGWIIYKLKQW